MKYANSLKFMSGFERAPSPAEISQKRAREICELLGRVQLGVRYICLPEGGAGQACALLLEAVIRNAGHRVGRITAAAGFDPRASILVDALPVPIPDFVKATAELKNALRRMEEPLYLEEAIFALGLLLCKLQDCDYVILQGMSDEHFSLDAVCAPYDLIVMPTVYDGERAPERVKTLCDAVRRGTREVVSGNQKSEVYNKISNACAVGGVRLYIPVKAQLEITEVSPRRLAFHYGGKEGYLLKSPSYVLRDAAITVIESALALRRGGMKIPWSSIRAGLAEVGGTGCFELLSASPLIVTDSASNREESELLLKTADELWSGCDHVALCVSGEALPKVIEAFAGREITRIVAVKDGETLEKGAFVGEVTVCESCEAAAKALLAEADETPVFCLGGVRFIAELRAEIVKALNS